MLTEEMKKSFLYCEKHLSLDFCVLFPHSLCRGEVDG